MNSIHTQNKHINLHALQEGLRDGIPIALGYLAVSFSLGIAPQAAGLTPFQGFLASITTNASAGEYACFMAISTGAAITELLLIMLITNGRYLLMSCSLSQKFSPGTPLRHRLLAAFAIKFGPYEYCTLALFALSLVISLTGRDLVKGLISGLLGVMLATVGLAPVDSAKRFTFGMVELNAGFSLLTLLIGLFAITEVIKAAEDVRKPVTATVETNVRIKGFGFSLAEFLSQKLNMVRSAAIGIVIGILPGIGGAISGMLAYTAAKNQSKHPEKFGTGIMDGVVASETANNAGIGGAMIPLLTLGIPGDAATAMLLGGLMVHQIAPGPLIFDKSGVEVFGIFFALAISAIAMLIIELFGIKIFIRVLKIPKYLLLPVIMVLCVIGAIGNANRMFDVWSVMVFGVMGYLLIKAKIPHVPMILGFILGPIFELNFRRAIQHAQIDPTGVFSHPIAICFFVVTIIVVIFSLRRQRKEAALLKASEES